MFWTFSKWKYSILCAKHLDYKIIEVYKVEKTSTKCNIISYNVY